ncbi:MAG: transglutaminase domain-containing protein [Chthoniobacterales bacterium]
MKLGVRYETSYRYEKPVSFAPHDLRLFPRSDRFSRVLRSTFQANGNSTVRFWRDVFENVVASCFFREPLNELRFNLEIDLALDEKDAFDFILEAEAVEMPFGYRPEVAAVLAPYLQRQTTARLSIPGWKSPTDQKRGGTVSSLVALNRALHESIGYQRRHEGAALAPEETLRRGCGACRDVAVLLAETLRAAGLAARLVSGYLRETDAESRRAEGSLHAWAEVFLPGAGWVGMDATNGVFCNHNFIAAAVGLRPADITPVSGSFYHDGKIPSEMTSRLELINL